ncbi:MAG: 2-amino-4-hydroxy-6-hydroxymethyldihydropteridine diphosphokinase [Thermodesulfobacteriota bacterium]
MSDGARAWVALGSNLGDSHSILQQAWRQLGEEGEIRSIRLSHPYVTTPVGMVSEHDFLNAVGVLETELAPESLLQLLQRVEKEFGRKRKTGEEGYQDRLLDLDILYYDDLILAGASLCLPHPHIGERLFVLAPLIEIDPQHRDPVTGRTAEQMYHEFRRQMAGDDIPSQQIRRVEWE